MAARLRYAVCDEHAELVDECPFCDDVAAYEAYLAAGGAVRRVVFSGETVLMEDFHKIPLNGGGGER
jgi:hypothetical protein